MLGRHDGAPGRWFDAHYRGLLARFGPFDGLTRDYASSVAGLYVEWRAASQALTDAQRRRREGKGRRPSDGQIARLQRRAGLAWQSYDSSLRRLEELSKSNGHMPDDPLGTLLKDIHRA